MEKIEKIDALLAGVSTVAIAGHIKPDGDCNGSTLALYNYIKNNYSDPIVDFVESLSLNEMGKMAQTLVNLTSFRRKYAGDIRTVGGITKVLLISKANGPVWFNEGRVNENDYFE